MLVLENILLALNGLRANKTRSVLTMLGIIIGIAAVIAIMTIGTSLTSSVTNQMNDMGASNITVGVQQKASDLEKDGSGMVFRRGPQREEMRDEDYLSGEMIDDIMMRMDDELDVALRRNDLGSGSISDKDNKGSVNVYGVNNDYIKNQKLEMVVGRIFTQRDQDQARKVIVVSDKLIDDVFKIDYEEALGKQITVVLDNKYKHYTIVGVYHYDSNKEMYSFSSDRATDMYLPLLTAFHENHTRERYRDLEITVHDTNNVDNTIKEIERYLNGRYFRNNESFEVVGFSMASMIKSYTEMMGTMSLAISVIAGISLLVGGIGVMNIMLVSIQERTREIGTRKALGATNSSIRMQFIVEAIVLCIVGGLIGILIGLLAGYFATPIIDEEAKFYPPINGIFMSVGFSVAVGVFFGYYPANKAAKMNPIDALRYE
ncbi:MAG: ABC transporter permease [Lachnospiraceae bacterium]|nr:ABC transporter permease [Lachnospiraceae bacterium]